MILDKETPFMNLDEPKWSSEYEEWIKIQCDEIDKNYKVYLKTVVIYYNQ